MAHKREWKFSEQFSKPEFERLLALGEPRSVTAGTLLIRKEATDDVLFWIRQGEIAVRNHDGTDYAVFGADSVVGEMAFVHAHARTADVYAKTDAQLVALPRTKVFGVLDAPTVAKLSTVLGDEIARRMAAGAPTP